MITHKPSKKKLAVGISIALVIVFFLTFYIWHQAESVSIGYSTRDLESKIKTLNKEIKELEARKASLLSLEKVNQVAREELRMVPPKDGQVIYDDIGLKN